MFSHNHVNFVLLFKIILMKIIYLLIAVLFLSSAVTNAQNYKYTLSDDSLVNHYASIKRIYHATRTNIVPKIDGKLNDECWQTIGHWDGNFIQQQPHQAKPPSQETEIKILYDDNYLYFGIICYDNEPEKMSPILGRRDDYTSGDITGIALDSYNDKQTAFEFNLTSAGQKVDLMHLGEYGWDFNWNAVWDGKTSIGDSAWFAEMRIPFTQIRFANQKEHVWGMHIWRWIHRHSEEDQWKLIPIDAPAMVYIFGELHGIKDIPYKRNFEVMPYAKAKYITDAENNQNFGFGLDGKISVTSDFTLDYTVNPDFGQVEADPSELNLTSYEVFYDEKRPFFLEGNSILEFGASSDLLFYSRRIGHAPSYRPSLEDDQTLDIPDNTSILNALKLTGKNKSGLSLGIINSMTAREVAKIFSGESKSSEAVEPFTNYFIGRLKQDFNSGSTVLGGMITSTLRNIKDDHLNFLPDNSLVGGIDFEHNWKNRKYFISTKNFFSNVSGSTNAIKKLQRSSRHLFQRVDAEHLTYDPKLTNLKGWGGEISGGKRSGKFRLTGQIDWRSPGLDLNDVGYLRQADYLNQSTQLIYRVNKPKGILLNYLLFFTQKKYLSYGMENLGNLFKAHGRVQLSNYWRIDADMQRKTSVVDTRQLRGGPSLFTGESTKLELFMQSNSQKDFWIAGGVENEFFDDNQSESINYDFHIRWLISNQFTLSSQFHFSNETDNNQYVLQKTIKDNREYVVGKIDRKTLFTTLRAEYFITPELSLQYYGSPYASVGKYIDFRRVVESKSKNIDERFEMLQVYENNSEKLLMDNKMNVYLDFSERNPDFNFQEFRSNFVARWEYKTGSTLYFVWTNNRTRYEEMYNSSVLNSLKGISKVKAQNAFMIKFSYWFSL